MLLSLVPSTTAGFRQSGGDHALESSLTAKDAYLAGVDLVAAECVVEGTHFGGVGCVTFVGEELFDLRIVDCRRD